MPKGPFTIDADTRVCANTRVTVVIKLTENNDHVHTTPLHSALGVNTADLRDETDEFRRVGVGGMMRAHIYTTINFTDEFRNVSVTLRVGSGLAGWVWSESRPELETVNK